MKFSIILLLQLHIYFLYSFHLDDFQPEIIFLSKSQICKINYIITNKRYSNIKLPIYQPILYDGYSENKDPLTVKQK